MFSSLIYCTLVFFVCLAAVGGVSESDEEEKVPKYRHYDGFKLFRAFLSAKEHLMDLQNLTARLSSYSSSSSNIRTGEEEGEGEDVHQKEEMELGKGGKERHTRGQLQMWKVHSQPGMPAEIFVGPSAEVALLKFFKKRNIAYQTLIEDFGLQMRVSGEKVRFDEQEEFLTSAEEFDLGRYHRYDLMEQYLQLLAKQHPKFCEYESIGKTTEFRDLAILKLGYPPPNNRTKKPILLLDAGIHAREWIAPAIALHVINAFVNNPKWNALLELIDVHIIPVMNPDGYEFTWTRDRLWRHTRSGPYRTSGVCEGDASFCYGSDPNRNFPYHWAESGTDPCPCSEIYPGQAPLSEPECAHLASYMQAKMPRLKAYLTLHSYGNLLIHAWNYASRTYPDNVDELREVAERMARAISQGGGPLFRVGSAPDILYEAAGGSDDFATSIGVKYSYTMELTSGRFGNVFGGFLFPERGINNEAEKVLPGIFVLAERVAEEATTTTKRGK